MKQSLFAVVLVSLAVFVSTSAGAQNPSSLTAMESSSTPSHNDQPFHGFNAYTSFSGLVTRSGSLLKLDSSVGYDFNRNFGVYAGLPLYLSNGFDESSSSQAGNLAGMGDAYIGAEVYAFPKLLRYSSSITVGIPTGSVAKGFSPGSVTADWTNHFRRSFGKLTPAFSVGIANTVGVAIGGLPSSQLIDGSLAAKGPFVHMEEGADFDLTRRVYIGGEGYHILPFSNHSAAAGSAGGDNVPVDSIVAENGIDAWVGFLPNSIVSTELGYSRSVTFGLNSLSFRMGFNVGRLLRHDSRQK